MLPAKSTARAIKASIRPPPAHQLLEVGSSAGTSVLHGAFYGSSKVIHSVMSSRLHAFTMQQSRGDVTIPLRYAILDT